MATSHIVLGHLTVVATSLLVQNTDRVGLLQKGIADVLLITVKPIPQVEKKRRLPL